MKKVLIIDGQGGKLGKQLAERILSAYPSIELTAVGSNSMATAAMMKSGVKQVATGENAVVVCAGRADVILGPIGIVIADSLLGEITPAMAQAVARSEAVKILIPSERCHNLVAGTSGKSVSDLIDDAMRLISAQLDD